MASLKAVKGMHDILPGDIPRWRLVEETFRDVARRYGFQEVRTPVVEPTALFSRGVGETTDIVEKEMYTFVDKGEKSLSLRPEGTASAVRAYVEHKVHAQEAISKWFYFGPMYRRERPAKGRYRQFFQLGAEILGDPGPVVDAELMEMLVRFFAAVGVADTEVLVSSLGSKESHLAFRDALLAYLRPHADSLSEDSQRRLDTNPLRILDSKVPADQEIAKGAPAILDHLTEEDRTHFDGLRRALDTFGVPYQVDASIVRGLDYYTRTVFEIKDRSGKLGAQDTICGGGRYDGLVKSLGGPDVPAIGFGLGVERLLLTMPDSDPSTPLDAFVVIATPDAEAEALRLLTRLRTAGLAANADLRGRAMKHQMRQADRSGARFALLLGEDELTQKAIQVRNLETGETRMVPDADIEGALKP